ncbi:hypothetical protein QBC33DRAFT_551276 [Phialemonium atrogriseum]|uniref:F-box domain-containing protein n=1 Tax=Phialemonium atrogriseum TaxID=1093897 RepID=A0AAJ0BSN8_9PEZI|nr:uncharacterized protein QBC33DRAFT_551276 [Phialemonium atrogriseum]KAK1762678.1 hypothetical protein QBC33DRAFT_551276 [Phialemonium atrogriseum]
MSLLLLAAAKATHNPHSEERCNQTSWILRLPAELVTEVFKHLPKASEICLTFTCRAFYNMFSPKLPNRLDRWTTQDLFLLLERDRPDSYYCFHCKKLHRWDPMLRGYQLGDWDGDCFRSHSWHDKERDSFYISTDHQLGFHGFRVIMNSHFYGPAHGFAPWVLEKEIQKTCPHTGCTIDEVIRTRIIDGELFVSKIYKMSHPDGDAKKLRQLVEHTPLRICRHLQIGRYWGRGNCWTSRGIRFLPRRIPELERSRGGGYFTGCSEVVRSCGVCMTDCQVDICDQSDGGQYGWSIKIVAWSQIGKGRDPLDSTWLGISRPGYDCHASWRAFAEEPESTLPGIVRHRWSKMDDMLVDVKGEFADGFDDGNDEGLAVDREGNLILECDLPVYDY